MVFIINLIHHLMNEFKLLIFAYNSDQRVYFLDFFFIRPEHKHQERE